MNRLFCQKTDIIQMRHHGCSAKKELWERRSTPIKKEDCTKYSSSTQGAFPNMNFHTGSSCFTVVLRCYTRDIYVIYAAPGAARRTKSSSNITSAKRFGNTFPSQHYIPMRHMQDRF